MSRLDRATNRTVGLCLCGWTLVAAVASMSCGSQELAAAPEAKATAPPQTEDENLMYFFGTQMSRSFGPYRLSEEEQALVVQGFRQGLAGEALELDAAVYLPRIRELAETRQAAVAAGEKEAARAFLAEAAAQEGARVMDSGLVFLSSIEGSGASPTATDTVRVHYHGTLRDSTIFDSSFQRGTPATFALNGVIPCWQEGLAMMKVGGRAVLWCPPEIAYGDQGTAGGIPGGAALRFGVELLEIVTPKAP